MPHATLFCFALDFFLHRLLSRLELPLAKIKLVLYSLFLLLVDLCELLLGVVDALKASGLKFRSFLRFPIAGCLQPLVFSTAAFDEGRVECDHAWLTRDLFICLSEDINSGAESVLKMIEAKAFQLGKARLVEGQFGLNLLDKRCALLVPFGEKVHKALNLSLRELHSLLDAGRSPSDFSRDCQPLRHLELPADSKKQPPSIWIYASLVERLFVALGITEALSHCG